VSLHGWGSTSPRSFRRRDQGGFRALGDLRTWAFLAFMVLMGCSGERREVDEYIRRLECGMSVETARDLARQHGLDALTATELGQYQTGRSRHTVMIGVSAGRVEWVQARVDGPLKRVESTPVRNLCTGEVQVFVTVDAPPPFIGASVHLDGRLVATFRASAVTIRTTPGKHALRIEKAGLRPFVKTLVVTDETGVVRLTIEEQDLQVSPFPGFPSDSSSAAGSGHRAFRTHRTSPASAPCRPASARAPNLPRRRHPLPP
jgi:hypothetical protein